VASGFDLVGPEFMGHPLRHFVPEFLAFRHKCDELGISEQQLPFIFHAGETTENGGSTDGNLYDALLLKSKRIGHGFALAQHLLLMQKYRDQKIALEICPISNEILHLCSRISEHSLTSLLANNVPCTLSCDNSTYFR
jgi:adenosine deaminase CECR1